MFESSAVRSQSYRAQRLRTFALLAALSLLLVGTEANAHRGRDNAHWGSDEVSQCSDQIHALIATSLNAPVSGRHWQVFFARVRLVAPLVVVKYALRKGHTDLAVAFLGRYSDVVQNLVDRGALRLGGPANPDLLGMAAAAIACLAGEQAGNEPPVANAGADAAVLVGQKVTLDGSASQDPDNDALTFAWLLIELPADSLATLDDPSSQTPSFMVDKPGTYRAQLVVNDGEFDSAPDTVDITTDNSPPVADAGLDQTAFVNDTVTLDGTGSTDVDGDFLVYQWSLTDFPSGSTVVLSETTAVMPTFMIDLPGSYVAELTVNDGEFDSAPDMVEINTLNSAPVADAGMDQTAFVGDLVQLDGSASFDVDQDSLTYRWVLTDIPPDSAAVLANEFMTDPTFTIDEPGTYTASLIVNDGLLDSDADIVLIATENSAPVADAGDDFAVENGDTVTLDGSGSSDADHDMLDYQWSLLTVAPGSSTVLSGANTEAPTFVADADGLYVAQLIVNDGTVDSEPDTVAVFAGDPEIFINDASIAEGDPGDVVTMEFEVTVSPPPTKPVTVNYFTSDDSARNINDYTRVFDTSVIEFAVGETSKTASVDIKPDLNVEPDETFFVTLKNPVNVRIGDGEAIGTILNDEDNVTVSIDDSSVAEGDSGGGGSMDFLVTLSGAPTKPVTVTYGTADGSAERFIDYDQVSGGLIQFAAGETEKTVSIDVIGDLDVEPDEMFSVNLTSAQNALIDVGSATGTILNDEDNITASIDNASATEGNPGDAVTVDFEVTLSAAPTKPVTVGYFTTSGSADGDIDYVRVPDGLIEFAAAETSKIVSIEVIEDLDPEPDETFSVTLRNPQNTLIDVGAATGTILNDDI